MTPAPTPDPLDARLTAWAAAYAKPSGAPPGLAAVIGHVLETAPANDDVDPPTRIEHIVRAMEQSGRWKEARVLRAEYFMAGAPEELRLHRLRRLGLPISRASYYIYLETARAFVSGALFGVREG